MDENTFKIGIAGFTHDVGKLVDKSILPVSDQYLMNNADLYQPFYHGHHTHRHAVYTAAFIEQMAELLPKQLNQPQWGSDDSFINLAAGHHKPETPMQWIVAIADRVSSGCDRTKFEDYNRTIPVRDYRKTRLLPIFETLMKDGGPNSATADGLSYYYPLREVSAESIFPAQAIQQHDNKSAAHEYRQIFDKLHQGLGRLLHKEQNLQLWFEHFESLMMLVCSSVPAVRVGDAIPDVSLYDHMKSTSALAVALYLYHRHTDSMTVEAVKDYDRKKFLLVSGDFYGIQSFVFSGSGEAKKNRSKILRGRSFAVSLFSELAADMLCREIGLPSVSIALNAAGKFLVIAPNTSATIDALSYVEKRVNDWLMKISFGESSMGISSLEASPGDFTGGAFVNLWDELALRMERRKFSKIDLDRFGGMIPGYLDSFRNDLAHPLCPFCGKRPSSPQVEGSSIIGRGESACTVCRDHIFLGSKLVKNNRVAITTRTASSKNGDNALFEPIFDAYQLFFADGAMNELARSGDLLKYWDISLSPEGLETRGATAKFINGYVPIYREEDFQDNRLFGRSDKDREREQELIDAMELGVPKTFEHISKQALNPGDDIDAFCGTEALGVLKADVDQLGMLMSCGLGGERFTVSRLATISRQLNWFFALYLPNLLSSDSRFSDIYTVFAGGDDLFLIGPWNRIIHLASHLHQAFGDYVCHNKEIHFSAGISIHKPHTPLDQMSSQSEAALEQSKDGGRNRITLFSETADWSRFMELQEIKALLLDWREREIINNAMLYRLNDFIPMAEAEKQIVHMPEVGLEHMECLKWSSLFYYATERNIGRGLEKKERAAAIQEFYKAALWLKEYGAQLKIALWDVLYNRRKGA